MVYLCNLNGFMRTSFVLLARCFRYDISDFWYDSCSCFFTFICRSTGMVKLRKYPFLMLLPIYLGIQVESDANDHRYSEGDTVPFYANKIGPYFNSRLDISIAFFLSIYFCVYSFLFLFTLFSEKRMLIMNFHFVLKVHLW